MKVTKKRLKLALTAIDDEAQKLVLLAEGLSLLEPLHRVALQVLATSAELHAVLVHADKQTALDAVAACEAVSVLDQIVDDDVVSVLENLFFADGDGEMPAFLQQLLDKLEKHVIALLDVIQQFNALLEDGDQ